MKLEIIKKQEFNNPTWYFLRVNDISITCSRDLEEIEKYYEEVKKDPNLANTSTIILKSEEINVNL
jgi:hypothetical protein